MTAKTALPPRDILNEPQAISFVLKDDGVIPNSSFPIVVYSAAVKLPSSDPASVFEYLFETNGWSGTWRSGIYTYHHYHSTTHEVLGVFKGAATVQLGGERGVKQKLTAGDVLIIPAGVAHKNLGASSDFGVVGAYPGGAEWDMNYGRPEERAEALENLKHVIFPKADPLYGANGPLLNYWKAKQG